MSGFFLMGYRVSVWTHTKTPPYSDLSVFDTGRRRRWTDDAKVRIVEESQRDGVTLAKVAQQHEISRSIFYDWRYRHKLGLLGCPAPFIRLVPMESGVRPDVVSPLSATQPIVMSIDLGERCRVTIPADFDMEAAARLLNGLVVTR